ncbi:MAG: hypothetical protein M3X11_22650 [Acidobacteriota bacterium]|nr:hypothetical protein [Acidobacteriota bacterium]
MKVHRILAAIIWSALLVGCGGLSSAQKQSAEVALKALRKIAVATKVSVSPATYSPLVIETKAQTDEAVRILPDGVLKEELKEAADAYVDAQRAWDDALSENLTKAYLFISKDQLLGSSAVMKSLIPKYGLTGKKESDRGGGKVIEYEVFGTSDVLKAIWNKAEEHISKAESALNSPK